MAREITSESSVEFGTHIKFVPGPAKAKTLTWFVVNKYDNGQIGWVGWYPGWRKYSYFARPETVYEQVCLREIASFCDRKTREHKLKAVIARQEALLPDVTNEARDARAGKDA